MEDRKPDYALVGNVDLVVIRCDEKCFRFGWPKRASGGFYVRLFLQGKDIICGVHNWDYQYNTGVSSYNNQEKLHKFNAWIEAGQVYVDVDEIEAWEKDNPQPYNRNAYLNPVPTKTKIARPQLTLILYYLTMTYSNSIMIISQVQICLSRRMLLSP